MKEAPKGWPRISSCLFYNDAAKAIDWLCDVFGFEVRLKVEGEGGRIEHSELVYGDGLIMVGSAGGHSDRKRPLPCGSPQSVGGINTQALLIQVENVDEHCARARAKGATIVEEPTTHDYGDDYWADRVYQAQDLEGHVFWFSHRVRG
ncbi:MAG: VOC family protein [Polyangiaceae bacterium]|nr:VOC family protein [Polyangiaceae bacterium]